MGISILRTCLNSGGVVVRAATAFSKLRVQFLGLGYCTEQNMDGIPSFVHCSLQLHKKLGWSVQILLFFFWGGRRGSGPPQPLPPVVAPLVVASNRGSPPGVDHNRRFVDIAATTKASPRATRVLQRRPSRDNFSPRERLRYAAARRG